MSYAKNTARRKKPLAVRILLTILCCLVGLLVLLVIGVRAYFRIPVSGYYRHSEKAFVIPGLSDGMTHQGLAYDRETDTFLITGYRSDGKPSQVSMVNRADGKESKRLWLADTDGKAFTGHVGGLTVWGDYVYVADAAGLAVYARADFIQASDGDTVRAIGAFSTESDGDRLGVAFVHAEGDRLYVGEFYREANYPTPDSHKYTTAAGEYNPALILVYRLDSGAENGILPEMEKAYSIPGLVQGMCLDAKGRICLSTSYATAFSHIYIYDNPRQEGEITVLGQTVPRYVLDSSSLAVDIKLAPMAEEIVVVDGKIYTMCESATDKYIFGKFTSARYCYATDLSAYN